MILYSMYTCTLYNPGLFLLSDYMDSSHRPGDDLCTTLRACIIYNPYSPASLVLQ